MEQFEIMDTDMLACVEGDFGGWGDMLSALLGRASTFSNFGSIKW